jgi:phosphatidylserine decarboxylase
MTVRRSATGAKVAIIAVGAMLVGSIFYVSGVDEQGAQIRRGQCLGGFKYGGSVCNSDHSLALR